MKKLLGICLLAMAVAACLGAQDISATIGGTVLDSSGGGVSNAKVTITNTDRNLVVRELTTETAGTYSAALLPIGNYEIKVEAKGFKTETRTGIVLNVSDSLKIRLYSRIYG
jgi:anthranilate/para-aminobenzoate synthase component II